jgi:DHA1 family chloramphenicol resistance protein-like MFS transporter
VAADLLPEALMLALIAFAVGHVVVALGTGFEMLLAARFLTALATGAFWAIAGVVATQSAGPVMAARAMGVVTARGMLATVLGVPLGAFAAQLMARRATVQAAGGTDPARSLAAASRCRPIRPGGE